MAQSPIEFLTSDDLKTIFAFEHFDDLVRLDKNGNEVTLPPDIEPVLTDKFLPNGKYLHYHPDGTVSDKADWLIRDGSLCLTFNWTDEEDSQETLGIEGCWQIEKRGNCLVNYFKLYPWQRLTYEKDGDAYSHIMVKYGDRANCERSTS